MRKRRWFGTLTFDKIVGDHHPNKYTIISKEKITV